MGPSQRSLFWWMSNSVTRGEVLRSKMLEHPGLGAGNPELAITRTCRDISKSHPIAVDADQIRLKELSTPVNEPRYLFPGRRLSLDPLYIVLDVPFFVHRRHSWSEKSFSSFPGLQTPRSVMKPVTSRLGVTSKA